jgi:hypothetical protein
MLLHTWKAIPCDQEYPSAPKERFGHILTMHDDKLYILGGIGRNLENYDDMWSFDLPTLKWTNFGTFPHELAENPGHCLVGDEWYVATVSDLSTKLLKINLKTMKSIDLGALPMLKVRGSPAVTLTYCDVQSKAIYLHVTPDVSHGSWPGRQSPEEIYAFDDESEKWTLLSSCHFANLSSTLQVGQYRFNIGGYPHVDWFETKSFNDTLIRYDVIERDYKFFPRSKDDPLGYISPLTFFGMGRFYMFGGTDENNCTDPKMYYFDIKNNATLDVWKTKSRFVDLSIRFI